MNKKFQFIRDAYRLIKPYWTSEQKYRGLLFAALILSFSFVQVYLSVRINEWNGVFYNYLQEYNKVGFFKSLIDGSIIMGCYVIVGTARYYCSSILEINWRKWLTSYYINNWFDSQAFYKSKFVAISHDNPDQRISDDVHQFVGPILQLMTSLFNSTLTLGSFIVILWGYSGEFKFNLMGYNFHIPGYMVWLALLYALTATWVTFKIGHPLIKLNFQQQQYEANFRYKLIRVRENAEQISAYDAAQIEQKIVSQDFDNVVTNFRQSIKRNLKINIFNYSYGQLSTIIPTIISAGRFFSKQITLGNMMQINSAFMTVQYSISYFVYAYSEIASLSAVMQRLVGFEIMVAEAKSLTTIRQIRPQAAYLTIQNLNIYRQDLQVLLSDFNLTATGGDRLLIQGVSGIGKSTLFKTINGLWQFADGIIIQKDGLKSLFISQKPYMPLINLKEAVCYPLAQNLPSDDVVRQILSKCGLANLINDLYALRDWSNSLSIGELQKIAFCRILINKPDIIYLDEATSALDCQSEAQLYQSIIDECPKSLIISIAHRTTITSFHNSVLNLSA